MRVAIVTKMLSPYRNPVFAEIANRPGIDLLVLTISENQEHRQWDLEGLYSQASFACERLTQGKGSPFGVLRTLRSFDPDAVVIGGYDVAPYWEALIYCKLVRRRAVLWSGTTARSVRRTGVAGAARAAFIRMASAHVAYGSLSRDFLIRSGASLSRIFIGYNTVDVRYFAERAEYFRNTAELGRLRERVGPLAILFVGRLISGKGLDQLFAALERMRELDWSLVILGDGPLRQALQSEAQRRHMRVYFEGFRNTRDLPLYYAACQFLVFPTLRESWGLVVNEAMACGLPVVSSADAGASYDLVRNGYNGWVVDPRDIGALGAAMRSLVSDEALRQRMGRASRAIIAHFTPSVLADAILSASSGEEAPVSALAPGPIHHNA